MPRHILEGDSVNLLSDVSGSGGYAETIGDGSATSFAVTHNLGTEDAHVQVWDVSGVDPVLANGDPSSVEATDVDTVTVAFGSAPATDQYRVVVLASGTTSSGGGSPLIERVTYNPPAVTTVTTSSTTFVDADATNLAVTFTAPASGKVLVVLEAICDAGASGNQVYQWNLREGSSNVAGTNLAASRALNNDSTRVRATVEVTGLTPGNLYTYKWGHRISSNTGRLIVGGSGIDNPQYGPAVIEVWTA